MVGRLVASSNAALYCRIVRHCPDPEPDLEAVCVYKPVRGERPLDDFPDGTLSRREVAAHVLSEATGWGIVPPTVFRDGPFGPGMVQLWIDVDEAVDPWDLVERSDPGLRPMAVFDAIVNNADRKGGHILPAERPPLRRRPRDLLLRRAEAAHGPVGLARPSPERGRAHGRRVHPRPTRRRPRRLAPRAALARRGPYDPRPGRRSAADRPVPAARPGPAGHPLAAVLNSRSAGFA